MNMYLQSARQLAEAANGDTPEPAATSKASSSSHPSSLQQQRPSLSTSSPARPPSGSRSNPRKPADTPASLAGQLQAPIRPTLNPLFRDFTATPRIPSEPSTMPPQQDAMHVDTHPGAAASEAALREQPVPSLRGVQSISHAPAPTEAGDSVIPADTPQAGNSRRPSEADVGHPVGQSRSLGVPPSPARPASYAAAAAASSPASSSPSRVPRRSSGTGHGLQSMGGQTDRATSRQQPHIRAASMTPPRRRTSDTPGGAPSGPQTHRGPLPAMHRLSGKGSGDGGLPRAVPDIGHGNATMGVPMRASGSGSDDVSRPHVSLQTDDIRSTSGESVSRMVAVPQLNFGSMQQQTSGSGTTSATQQPVPDAADKESTPQLSIGSRQRRSSGSMIASAEPAGPAVSCQKAGPAAEPWIHAPASLWSGGRLSSKASLSHFSCPTACSPLEHRISAAAGPRIDDQGQVQTEAWPQRLNPPQKGPSVRAQLAHIAAPQAHPPQMSPKPGQPKNHMGTVQTSRQLQEFPGCAWICPSCLRTSELPRQFPWTPMWPQTEAVH